MRFLVTSASASSTFLLWQARADSCKAREQLGVEFRPWQQGIRETARWIVEGGRV